MIRSTKDISIGHEKKSSLLNYVSIANLENFEPPQMSSTPAKIGINNSKRILKDNNRLNISVIRKKIQRKSRNRQIDNKQLKSILPIEEDNLKYDLVPELFYDPEESLKIYNTTIINDSDDKWTTFSSVSEDKSLINDSDLIAEIGTDVEVRFEKPPKRSYLGRKRNNSSLYDLNGSEEKENEGMEPKIAKKDKKPKLKENIGPQEEALILSLNEHFNDVESFNLTIE